MIDILGLFKYSDTTSFKRMKSVLSRRYPLRGADLRCSSKKGLVSVVLPVYNCEEYLAESIDSILSQTYTNFEVIIVDDGSEDSSGRIADSYAMLDERIRVIHQKNMKLPNALNTGFSSAKGEFMTWTSADNRMLPACIETLAAELIRDRSCDMVFGNMRLIDENGDILKGKGWFELPPFSGNVILPDSTAYLNTHANNTIGAAFMYRSGAAAVLNGYSENLFMLEDYDYFMRMNSIFSIKHVLKKQPIYEYRMHSKSLTSRDEELGITESRPALMSLDKIRRDYLTKPISFYADGDSTELASSPIKPMNRILSAKTAEKLSEASPKSLFYVNFGNVAPTWDVPDSIPKFLVMPSPTDCSYGYDVLICRDSSKLSETTGWVCPAGKSALSAFIFYRAKNDLISSFEKEYLKDYLK